ncbi:hypothetical protein [Desulfovibrio litoralis]|uniref:Uncharacterized protein n=1 Tax=Desulfovibrio litoralis DSM 11393 TaxID=1121455 RepID=A0A1M7SCN5_9BACT|nr:hypothetical protein [Desulfovibrio litoralis]SHN56209.1 hypothetical protein SAMN02745728_00762 [Desulfovibrio litoralis DSM 11393]
MEQISLKNEFGDEVRFRGRMFSESSYYEDVSGVLTRHCLYKEESGQYVYSIVSGSAAQKSYRVYKMRIEGENCIINNGALEMNVSIDLLLSSVFNLCGIDNQDALDLRETLVESLNTASC